MHEAPGTDWTYFGKHRHRFESPDIYYRRVEGDVSGPDMQTQIDGLVAIHRRIHRPVFWLCDVRTMGLLTPEARRAAASASSSEVRAALRGSAVFGSSFGTRVMMGLLVRAVRVLNPNKLRPLLFATTEAEARAFLDDCRLSEKRTSVHP
jgi:hypothetical protein